MDPLQRLGVLCHPGGPLLDFKHPKVAEFQTIALAQFHNDVVEKAGAWFSYGETRLGQGFEKSIDFLVENADIANAIEKEIRLATGMLPTASGEPDDMVFEAKKEDDKKDEKGEDKKED